MNYIYQQIFFFPGTRHWFHNLETFEFITYENCNYNNTLCTIICLFLISNPESAGNLWKSDTFDDEDLINNVKYCLFIIVTNSKYVKILACLYFKCVRTKYSIQSLCKYCSPVPSSLLASS